MISYNLNVYKTVVVIFESDDFDESFWETVSAYFGDSISYSGQTDFDDFIAAHSVEFLKTDEILEVFFHNFIEL